jgi:hypothetical protein
MQRRIRRHSMVSKFLHDPVTQSIVELVSMPLKHVA